MQLDKVRNRLRRAAAEAALGGYAEIGHNLFCRGQPTSRAGQAIGTMHKPQIEFSSGIKFQPLERREIGDISRSRGTGI